MSDSASSELLVDALSRGTGISRHDAQADLDELSRPENLPTLIAHLVSTAGTDPVVAALADTVDPGNLVTAMVEQGVLVEAGAGWRTGEHDGDTGPVLSGDGERPPRTQPLYRTAEPEEVDRA